ncbi:MAG: hypothetical protein ACWA5A_17630 [Marinibacterium sp.]
MKDQSDPLRMRALERGRVRVFALSMSRDEVRRLDAPNRLAEALGTDIPPLPGRVEVLAVSDLEGVGLAGYLIEGCGVPQEVIDRDRARLDALDGHVLLLYSRAFGDRTVTLDPVPQLTLIGTYAESRPAPPGPPVDSDSARPGTGPAREAPRAFRARARRTGAVLFVFFMALLAVVVYLVVA